MSNNELTLAQVKPFIVADLKAGQTPALLGEPGIGKTSLIIDLERDFKTKVFILPVNQLADRADLTGVRMTQDKNKNWQQEAFPHSVIMESIQYAKDNPDEFPILFLDEFNRASSDITSAILSFQTLRRIGAIDFPDNLRLIVAGNDKGNVTSLDGASISRFSVYRVKPDLETFLSVQELNPFIRDVLAKFPDDLMALESGRTTQSADDDDEDDEDSEDFAFAQLEFIAEDSFAQITRPRTITYTSEWLNEMGINKSGDDKEKELLGSLFTSMTDSGHGNILLAGIEAHVGQTTFAFHLFDEIQSHFNTLLSSAHASNKPVLDAIRPNQSMINQLSKTTTVTEVEELIESVDDKQRLNMLIWLTENTSVKEINNNNAVDAYMKNAPYNITQFDNATIENLMKVLPDSSRVSKLSTEAMLSSSAPVIIQWKTLLDTIIKQS